MNQQTTQKEPTDSEIELINTIRKQKWAELPLESCLADVRQHVAACVARETLHLTTVVALKQQTVNKLLDDAAHDFTLRHELTTSRAEVSRLRDVLTTIEERARIAHEMASLNPQQIFHAQCSGDGCPHCFGIQPLAKSALSPVPAEVNPPGYEAWKAQQDAEEAEKRRLDESLKASPPLAPRADEGTPTPRTEAAIDAPMDGPDGLNIVARLTKLAAELEGDIVKMRRAGDALAERLSPGPIPAESPTDTDYALANWEEVRELSAARSPLAGRKENAT